MSTPPPVAPTARRSAASPDDEAGLRGWTSITLGPIDHAVFVAATTHDRADALAALAAFTPDFEDVVRDRPRFTGVPTAAANLIALGLPADHPLAPRLRGIVRQTWLRNQMLLRAYDAVARELESAHVEHLVLKGLALAAGTYPSLGARKMEDVDVMVRPDQFRRALDRLVGSGLRPVVGFDPATGGPMAGPADVDVALARIDRPEHHHGGRTVSLLGAHGTMIDLHEQPNRLLGIPADAPATHDLAQGFWRRAVTVRHPTNGPAIPALASADQLLVTVARGGSLRPTNRLAWLIDAHLIVAGSPELDWRHLVRAARASRLTIQVGAAARHLRDAGLAVPGWVPDSLAASSTTWRDDLLYRRIISMPDRHPVLGAAPVTLLHYLETTRHLPAHTAIRGLPTHLRREWGLPGAAAIPGRLVAKALAVRRDQRPMPGSGTSSNPST